MSIPRQAWRQRTGVAGGLRIRRYLPEAVIVLGALYCAGLPIYRVTTISFTSALYIALAVVLAMALMLPRPARTHLALVLASFGTALLLAEVYFSATGRSTLEIREIRLNSAREAGRTVDLRSRVAIVRDLRAQGVDAMPAPGGGQLVVSGPAGRVLPVLAGVSMATTVHCNESGQYNIYDADEHGFNNPRGLHGQAPLQVALLGDSFTHGACVPREASVAGRVRAAFPATLNLGISGTGPLHQLAIFREYAAALQPQFVVWNWFEGNDLRDVRRDLNRAPLRAYLKTNTPFGLRHRQPDIDRTSRVATDAELRKHSSGWRSRLTRVLLLRSIRYRLGIIAAGLELSFGDEFQAATEEELVVAEQILVTARDVTHSWGGELVMVYLPDSRRYCSDVPAWRESCGTEYTWPGMGWLDDRDDVLAMFARLGVPVIDGHAAFVDTGQAPDDFFYFLGSHYSPAGYQVIAEAVLRTLQERLATAEPTSSAPSPRQ